MGFLQPFTEFVIGGTEELLLSSLEFLLDGLPQVGEVSAWMHEPLPTLIREASLTQIR